MAKNDLIRTVMITDPITIEGTSSLIDAAIAMAGADIGVLPVIDADGSMCGVVTDRDLVVRGLARGCDPNTTRVGEVCSRDLACLTPDDSIAQAVQAMREGARRRLPIVEDGRPVGMVSLGDLAIERDPESALAGISAAPPNR